MGVWVIVSAVVMLAGCESKGLLTCREDNVTLQTKVDSMQKDVDKANTSLKQKDAEIAKIKADNVEMQNTAMESIMTMLKKEEDRSKKLQAAITEKDTELKCAQDKIAASSLRISELEKKVNTLQSLVKEQYAVTTPAAQPQHQ
jgi:septal ring factor EnvC (AmiA/AmiB activator)